MMTRWLVALSFVALGLCQATVMAYCPAGETNEIFCDDFDTYCLEGGYPGGAGAPVGTKCPDGSLVTPEGVAKLHEVWLPTSTDEYAGTPCGTLATLDKALTRVTSTPFAIKYPGTGSLDEIQAQHTFRDWINSTQGNDILNMSHLINNLFGKPAVAGTDGNPLVLKFMLDSTGGGGVFYSSGYIELANGEPTYLNRANTDYDVGAYCGSYCSPGLDQGGYPVVCALGNPQVPLSIYATNCPNPAINPPPVHSALAIGIFAMIDSDPCHCGTGTAHGGTIYHMVFYNGRLWYELRDNTPVTSTGTVTPIGSATMPPPADIHAPGYFLTWGGPANQSLPPFNWMTLTVKTSTVTLELLTKEESRTAGYQGMQYWVYSVMENVPRAYTGPFNTLRGGVGGGCELASTSSWDVCATGTDRHCMDNVNAPASKFVDMDDLVVYGGTGYDLNGACCLDNADCVNGILQTDCESEPPAGLGGVWRGSSTTCATLQTPCCPVPFADGDHDGNVDHDDFGMFQVCYTGTSGGVPPGCYCFDHDGDNDIDHVDFTAFSNCYSGANVPWSQALTPSCTP